MGDTTSRKLTETSQLTRISRQRIRRAKISSFITTPRERERPRARGCPCALLPSLLSTRLLRSWLVLPFLLTMIVTVICRLMENFWMILLMMTTTMNKYHLTRFVFLCKLSCLRSLRKIFTFGIFLLEYYYFCVLVKQ